MNKLAGLVVGYRETASLGRVAFWAVFGLCVYFWLARPVDAFPSSLEFALVSTMAYNLGGKAVNKFSRPERRPETAGKAHDDPDQD